MLLVTLTMHIKHLYGFLLKFKRFLLYTKRASMVLTLLHNAMINVTNNLC